MFLAKRLRSHREEILYFLEDLAIEYTNNLSAVPTAQAGQAERALRHGVVNRKVTYGNRSKWGKGKVEKMGDSLVYSHMVEGECCPCSWKLVFAAFGAEGL